MSRMPNKRLKLAGGGIALKKAECCAPGGHGLRPAILCRRASRSQRRRDPLGGNTRGLL